jgi:cytidylate kinase
VSYFKPNILLSGYTAAGKTTHARLLAIAFGLQYVGASEIRRSLMDAASEGSTSEWDPTVDLRRERSLSYDRSLDEIVSRRISTSPTPVVADAWLQPWLSVDSHALRVWIESTFESRVRKAAVTFLRLGLEVPVDIEMQVREKDSFSRRMFRRLYDIKFGPDPAVFDLIIDNSSCIGQPAIEASDSGIAQFEPMLERAIEETCSRKLAASTIAFYAESSAALPTSGGTIGHCGWTRGRGW